MDRAQYRPTDVELTSSVLPSTLEAANLPLSPRRVSMILAHFNHAVNRPESDMSRITHLKIKIKNLAAESGIIRLEERKLAKLDARLKAVGAAKVHFTERVELAYHRRGVVRDVARENLLAYGFLRGRKYACIENKTNSVPYFHLVSKHAKSFSSSGWGEEEKLKWEEWFAEAKVHIASQHSTLVPYLNTLKIAA